MCDPLCQGRILCDDTTYKESKDEIEFANERYQLQVKGSDYPISAHVPTKKRAGHVKEDNSSSETENIYGRDAELLMMRRILQDHINGRETVHLLISGATGTGKTLFVDSFKKQAQDQELFVCHTRGSETSDT
ncbi:hypothetical protein BC829DRAFT_42799 [Chytridium lagenaria]|nr:hypothetical protein BC829DRAFT_42799 [Chytridium lagenaria]